MSQSIPAPSLLAAERDAARPRHPLQRALGALGMVAAPAFFVQWIADGPFAAAAAPQGPDLRRSLFDLLYLAGFMASAVALRRLRATGSGRGAAVLFAVQMLGLALAATQDLQDLAGVRPLGGAFYAASDVAWPLSHVLMLVVFAAVWRARVWTGWRRWVPLACGLVLPTMLAAAAIGGRVAMGFVFCPGTAASFLALGLAVFTAPRTGRLAR